MRNPLLAAPQQGPKTTRSSLVTILSLGLAAGLLYWTLSGLDWGTFWQTIRGGHYGFILITIPIASFNYLVRAIRWSVLVRAGKKVPLPSVFWANMVGYMGNSYLPARAGELLRSAFLGQRSGLGTSFVLATALAERTLDLVALVLIGSTSLLLQPGLPAQLAGAMRILALGGFAGLVIIVLAPFQEPLIVRIFAWLPLPEKIKRLGSEQIVRFLLGMRSLQSARRSTLFVLLTLAVWLIEAIGATFAVRIVGHTITIVQALTLLSALGLSSAIPSTPGYLGVHQFVAVNVLMPFGFSRADALAYSVIIQIKGYLVISFWGLIGLWRVHRAMSGIEPRS